MSLVPRECTCDLIKDGVCPIHGGGFCGSLCRHGITRTLCRECKDEINSKEFHRSTEILKSNLDPSVNFVLPADVGYFEARYVRRDPRYFSLYLSSQSGCNQGCRMCHLTATKQTKFADALHEDYIRQAHEVFKYYDNGYYDGNIKPATDVHFNFMARGEALDNPFFLSTGHHTLLELGHMAATRHLVPRFLVSTIMPKSLGTAKLADFFPLVAPEIYYSIYSTSPDFRKKWLPQAMPYEQALVMLKEYQDRKRVLIKLHWALIKDENDASWHAVTIADAVKKVGLRADFSLVQYNSFGPNFGEEASDERYEGYASLLRYLMPESKIKIVKRVGYDVKASCGMFIDPKEKA